MNTIASLTSLLAQANESAEPSQFWLLFVVWLVAVGASVGDFFGQLVAALATLATLAGLTSCAAA